MFVAIAAMTVRYFVLRGVTSSGPPDDGVQEVE
jgi:hypothetical protein